MKTIIATLSVLLTLSALALDRNNPNKELFRLNQNIHLTETLLRQVSNDLADMRIKGRLVVPEGKELKAVHALESQLREQQVALQDRIIALHTQALSFHKDSKRPCDSYCKDKFAYIKKIPDAFGVYEYELRNAMDCKICWNGDSPQGTDFGYDEPAFSLWIEQRKAESERHKQEFKTFWQSVTRDPIKGVSHDNMEMLREITIE